MKKKFVVIFLLTMLMTALLSTCDGTKDCADVHTMQTLDIQIKQSQHNIDSLRVNVKNYPDSADASANGVWSQLIITNELRESDLQTQEASLRKNSKCL